MKLPALFTVLALGCLAALGLRAAEPSTQTPGPAPLTPAQIDELLAPIALYPDPLVAIILPAATFPTDIVLAARYLDAKRDPEAIDDQPWDDSVKSLARYPDVVKWMDENLEWTEQLGAAFTLQPAALLTGTQRLRSAAIAAGNLKTTPEQSVIVEKEVVRIVPAQREIIYVPVYDPYWVYRPCAPHTYYHPRSIITFSSGYRTGFWLSYHFNWGSSAIVIVNRPYRTVVWHNYPAWHYPSHTVVHHHHVWRPAPIVVHKVRRDYHRRPVVHIVQPTVNVHVQRNVTRNVNRDVTINRDVSRERNVTRDLNITRERDVSRERDLNVSRERNITRERDVSPEREITVNRERTANRPAGVTTSAPALPPGREVVGRTAEDFRRQARAENREITREVNRDVVRRPATNAPEPGRAPAVPARLDQARPVRTPMEPVLAQRVSHAATPAPAVTPSRPAPGRPAFAPAQDSLRTRGGPVASPAPQESTPPRMRSAMPAERPVTAARPPRTPLSVPPSLEEQGDRRGFNRTR
jgi:hypothetical protein